MKCVEVFLNEETIDGAIELLRKSKGKKVMIVIQNLEEEDVNLAFVTKYKNECQKIIENAATVAISGDDFLRQLSVFTEKQRDLKHIQPRGYLKTILLN